MEVPEVSAAGTRSEAAGMKGAHLLNPAKPGLAEYIVAHSFRNPDTGTEHLEELYKASLKHPQSIMCSPPESVPVLQMLLKLMKARTVVEVGVFTGYTALAMALVLPDNGKIFACDITDEYPSIGKPYWEAAGVAGKIDLRIGPATATLDNLLESEGEGSIDAGFIDANKNDYDAYYEKLLKLLRPGGLIIVDNVLWFCDVLDANAQDADTKAIQTLNDKIIKDKRVHVCMLPVSDGITLALKK